MAAPATLRSRQTAETTLLELVQAVSEVARSEQEVVATVLYMLRSGSVQLRGSFRGSLLEDA
jgi:hypothetical protein